MNKWVGLMLAIFWACCIPCGNALDLGVQGSVTEIQEEDALIMIEQRLINMKLSGEIDRQAEQLKKQALKSITQPKPVLGLKPTIHPRTFEMDLTITVPFDIKDDEGNLIQPQGKRINPLEEIFTNKSLIFFDGEDAQQLTWALEQHKLQPGFTKLVLVNGSPLDLMERYEIPFYFDQAGKLSRYFKLEQIPAKVFQQQDKLIIHEAKV
jgi:conjugal transfer pilus assembly protein TraW